MHLHRRLVRIERDVATRAKRDAEASRFMGERQVGKRVWSAEELEAAFDQYIPGWRDHAQTWLDEYARMGLLPHDGDENQA
jgi:hypothetical protein